MNFFSNNRIIMATLSPAKSGELIARFSKYVKINENGIRLLAQQIFENVKNGKLTLPAYTDVNVIPPMDSEKAIDWIFFHDTLNFCFWTRGDETKWKVNGYTGYFALCAAFNRAIQEGFDISSAQFCSKITEEQLANIMRSDDGETTIPLLQLRVKCLHEVGFVLLEKYNGTFKTCIIEANKSAKRLLDIVVTNFPCFRDESVFEGTKVSFYKRAQILIADLWSSFSAKDWGEFEDIDNLTMFADYRVPQVLVHLKALEYSNELYEILNADNILLNGSREEIEIRGCSIHAVELVKEHARELMRQNGDPSNVSAINSSLIDFFLWLYRRNHAKQMEYIPFHKVLSPYY